MIEREVIWQPQPGFQKALIDCPFSEVFGGGARGGGKTAGVIGHWALKEQRYGKAFNARMFRRTVSSAEDAIEATKQIFGQITGPFQPKFNEQQKTWRMAHGGRMGFAYLDSIADADQQQGKNLTDAWVEEVGQYPSPAPIDKLFGALRSGEGVPTQMILTGNPGGPGQHWLADRYKLIPFPLRPQVVTRMLANGYAHKMAVIPSRITDNKILMANDPNYINKLQLVGSAALVRAWVEGDWSAIEGAFFPEFSNAKHVVEPFQIPDHWMRFRSADWGSAKPFCIQWWAVVSDDTRLRSGQLLPRGALVLYREWYGASGINIGLKMPAETVGHRIREIEEKYEPKNAQGEPDIAYGVIDPATFASDGGPSIAERMWDDGKGVMWRPADNKRSGTLGAMGGWDQVRARLIGTGRQDIASGSIDWSEGDPALFIFSSARDAIRTLPALQHDRNRPEDCDSAGDDHCFVGSTLVDTADGPQRIDALSDGYVYSTHDGPLPYRNARLTQRNQKLVRLHFEDGRTIDCTPNHNFVVSSDEMRYAKDLQGTEVLCRIQLSSVKQSRNTRAFDGISAASIFSVKIADGCTFACGWIQHLKVAARGLCQKGIMSTIKTKIDTITLIGILSVSPCWSTYPASTERSLLSGRSNRFHRHSLPLLNGMDHQKVERGTKNTIGCTAPPPWSGKLLSSVKYAAAIIKRLNTLHTKVSFVVVPVKRVRCVRVEELSHREDVYCLTVPATGVFSVCNGILVANSPDTLRYSCSSRPYVTSLIVKPEQKYLADATLDEIWSLQSKRVGGRI